VGQRLEIRIFGTDSAMATDLLALRPRTECDADFGAAIGTGFRPGDQEAHFRIGNVQIGCRLADIDDFGRKAVKARL
jgi:hypothetical protein